MRVFLKLSDCFALRATFDTKSSQKCWGDSMRIALVILSALITRRIPPDLPSSRLRQASPEAYDVSGS